MTLLLLFTCGIPLRARVGFSKEPGIKLIAINVNATRVIIVREEENHHTPVILLLCTLVGYLR